MAAVRTPTHPHDTARRRPAATIASAALGIAAVVASDATIAAIAATARHVVDPLAVAWMAATAVVAVVGYAAVGVPQIHLGRAQTTTTATTTTSTTTTPPADRRTRWAMARAENAASIVTLLIVSIVGGPLAVGLLAGRRHDPAWRAHAHTAAAAITFAAVWTAAYLGAVAAIF